MDAKELKKLVKVCREMGVKSYRGADFEFTLTESAPVKPTKKSAPVTTSNDSEFETDTLTTDELLFWSAVPNPQSEETNDKM